MGTANMRSSMRTCTARSFTGATSAASGSRLGDAASQPAYRPVPSADSSSAVTLDANACARYGCLANLVHSIAKVGEPPM